MSRVTLPIEALSKRGVEVLNRGASARVTLPARSKLEAPCSLKWTAYDHSLHLGAFSYQVSGYCFAGRIGRYCSFGEDVQIGRQDHPLTWASTSPAFYLNAELMSVGDDFAGAAEFRAYSFAHDVAPTVPKLTTIGNDVWIGHGAMVCAGVNIGDGAIVAANAVVARDVPPYAVVAGNPATIKKFRVPPMQITPLLRARWWRFAPWQLQHLDPKNIPEFIRGVHDMNGEPEFAPSIIDLTEELS